jgi:hypothetical protein
MVPRAPAGTLTSHTDRYPRALRAVVSMFVWRGVPCSLSVGLKDHRIVPR